MFLTFLLRAKQSTRHGVIKFDFSYSVNQNNVRCHVTFLLRAE